MTRDLGCRVAGTRYSRCTVPAMIHAKMRRAACFICAMTELMPADRCPFSQVVERSFRMKTQAMGRPDMSRVSPRATSAKPLAL